MIEVNSSLYSALISTLAFLFSIVTFVYNIWRGLPSLKITFPDELLNIIFHPLNQDSYLKETRICINAQIANLSSNPISISHFSLRDIDKSFNLSSKSFVHADDDYYVAQYPCGGFYTIPIGKEQITLPLKIAPYSIVIGYVFFVVDIPVHPFYGILTAHTPTKDFSFDVKINTPTLPHKRDVAFSNHKQNTQETENH